MTLWGLAAPSFTADSMFFSHSLETNTLTGSLDPWVSWLKQKRATWATSDYGLSRKKRLQFIIGFTYYCSRTYPILTVTGCRTDFQDQVMMQKVSVLRIATWSCKVWALCDVSSQGASRGPLHTIHQAMSLCRQSCEDYTKVTERLVVDLSAFLQLQEKEILPLLPLSFSRRLQRWTEGKYSGPLSAGDAF